MFWLVTCTSWHQAVQHTAQISICLDFDAKVQKAILLGFPKVSRSNKALFSPVCVVVVCPSIGSFSLEHGRWRIVNGSHYEYRTRIVFTCDPGYYRLGPAHIQCLANGVWSWKNERPHCQSE